MSPYLYIIIIGFFAFQLIKNFKMAKDTKATKGFTTSYQALIKEDEEGYTKVCEALETETSPIYKSGISLIKTIFEMQENRDYQNSFNDIDLNVLFYSKGKFDNNLFTRNADCFLWMTLLLANAKNIEDEDVADRLLLKFEGLDELKETLEYHFIKAAKERIFDKEETFLNELIEGEYSPMPHSKGYIGFIKQTAEAILDSKGVVLDQFYLDDLKNFVGYAYAKYLMSKLGNVAKFAPKEETIEDKEENK